MRAPRAHHFEAGPSRLDRVIACPGSVVASRAIEEAPMPAAEHGKRLHRFLETCLLARTLPADYPDEGEWALFGPEDREAVAAVVHFVRDLQEAYPGPLLLEAEVDLQGYFPGLVGRADVAILSGRTLVVVDAKFGRHVVAATSAQLKAYGLGLLEAYPALSFEEVVLVIAQPFARHFDELRTTPDALVEWARQVMVPALEEAFGPAPPVRPSEAACRFCPARALCATRKAEHHDAVVAQLDAAGDVALCSRSEIAAMLANAERFEAYINDVRDFALRELLAGRPIPGFKLVEGRALRKWANEKRAIGDLQAALLSKRPDLAPEAAQALITTVSPITISAAEKLLGRANPCFATLTIRPQGRPLLAPQADARPAFVPAQAVGEALESVPL